MMTFGERRGGAGDGRTATEVGHDHGVMVKDETVASEVGRGVGRTGENLKIGRVDGCSELLASASGVFSSSRRTSEKGGQYALCTLPRTAPLDLDDRLVDVEQ